MLIQPAHVFCYNTTPTISEVEQSGHVKPICKFILSYLIMFGLVSGSCAGCCKGARRKYHTTHRTDAQNVSPCRFLSSLVAAMPLTIVRVQSQAQLGPVELAQRAYTPNQSTHQYCTVLSTLRTPFSSSYFLLLAFSSSLLFVLCRFISLSPASLKHAKTGHEGGAGRLEAAEESSVVF